MADVLGGLTDFSGENGLMKIVLLVAVIGGLIQSFAPGLSAPIGKMVGKPLDAVMWTYVLLFFIYTVSGQAELSKEMMKPMGTMLLVVLVMSSFFKMPAVDTGKYLAMIVFAPLVGNFVKGFLPFLKEHPPTFGGRISRDASEDIWKWLGGDLTFGKGKDGGPVSLPELDRALQEPMKQLSKNLGVLRTKTREFNDNQNDQTADALLKIVEKVDGNYLTIKIAGREHDDVKDAINLAKDRLKRYRQP